MTSKECIIAVIIMIILVTLKIVTQVCIAKRYKTSDGKSVGTLHYVLDTEDDSGYFMLELDSNSIDEILNSKKVSLNVSVTRK